MPQKRIQLLEHSPAAFQTQVCSYEGWAKHCNSKHLLKTLYNEKSRIRSAAS